MRRRASFPLCPLEPVRLFCYLIGSFRNKRSFSTLKPWRSVEIKNIRMALDTMSGVRTMQYTFRNCRIWDSKGSTVCQIMLIIPIKIYKICKPVPRVRLITMSPSNRYSKRDYYTRPRPFLLRLILFSLTTQGPSTYAHLIEVN